MHVCDDCNAQLEGKTDLQLHTTLQIILHVTSFPDFKITLHYISLDFRILRLHYITLGITLHAQLGGKTDLELHIIFWIWKFSGGFSQITENLKRQLCYIALN